MVNLRNRWAFFGLGLLGSVVVVGCSGSVKQDDGCVYGGTRYDIGARFSSTDGCNTCACTANGAACTEIACAGDTRIQCRVGARSYAPGEQVSSDGCNTCQCTASGQVACTARDCQPDAGSSCDSLREQASLELAKLRSCNSAAECGQPIPGSSCGCTRDLVARQDADLGAYLALRSEVASRGCANDGGSTCDCPSANGFACIDHTCAWNYAPEPIPEPKPEPTCQAYDPAVLCVHGTPTATGELIAVGDPLQISVQSKGCLSSSCSKVQEASCAVSSGQDFEVQASFCVSDTHAPGQACTADCGTARAKCSFGQPLTAGDHQVKLGALAIGFQVPSTLPVGGLCAGMFEYQ